MSIRAIVPNAGLYQDQQIAVLQDRDATVIRVGDSLHVYFPKGSELDTRHPNYDKVTVPFVNKADTRDFFTFDKGVVENTEEEQA